MKIKWTTEPPTKAGFYWAKCENNEYEIIEVYPYGDGLYWKCLGDAWCYGGGGDDWRAADMRRATEPLEVPK